jgi:hypothetical protein
VRPPQEHEEEQQVADRKKVAEGDGAYRTNRVTVEPGYFLAPGYEFADTDAERGDTGRLKVLRIRPADEQSDAPRFLGRWDDGRDQSLDFNLVDRNDNQIGKLPYGHHPDRIEKPDGRRRYQVEIGRDEKHIIFKGVVEVALGFRKHLSDTLGLVDDLKAVLIPGKRSGPDSSETGGNHNYGKLTSAPRSAS